MLAKAVATEGGATFLSIDASSIENKWLGESEKNARAMFTLARRLSPCVIYIDEVDSILSSREQGDESSHGTLTSVKTTIMQEWDGLRSSASGAGRVVVIGSTNRPFDLDEAVLRRMPRRILVDLPDVDTREAILKVSLQHNRVSADVNLTAVAKRLEGYTGSDIKEVCREAVVRISHEAAAELEANPNLFEATLQSGPRRKGQSATRTLGAEGDAAEAFWDLPAVREPLGSATSSSESGGGDGSLSGHLLRPVTKLDLERALGRLSASVNERGREIAKVAEWNEQYGEIKQKKKRKPEFSMYL